MCQPYDNYYLQITFELELMLRFYPQHLFRWHLDPDLDTGSGSINGSDFHTITFNCPVSRICSQSKNKNFSPTSPKPTHPHLLPLPLNQVEMKPSFKKQKETTRMKEEWK
jgi:hypothetical protein